MADSVITVTCLKNEVIEHFSFPLVIYNDNGTHFRGHCSKYLFANKVKQIFALAYHPQSIGLAKRYVQLFKVSIQKAFVVDYNLIHNWLLVVSLIRRDLN